MEERWKPTVLRVFVAIIVCVLLTFVVGGLTETLVSNDVAQFVRKVILLGSAMSIGQWVARWFVSQRQKSS